MLCHLLTTVLNVKSNIVSWVQSGCNVSDVSWRDCVAGSCGCRRCPPSRESAMLRSGSLEKDPNSTPVKHGFHCKCAAFTLS